MKSIFAAAIAGVLFTGTASAAPMVAPSAGLEGVGQVEQAKWKAKHRFKRNRGLHRGWYIGRGNPHRHRRYRRW
jgi:opacity protein-like surface antigen